MPRRKKAPEAERPPKRAEPEIDREIAEDFQERQELSQEGRERLAETLDEHNALSPKISADDVDAAWEIARESGEETFTGHAPTPDQDRVDDMGAAAGLTYKDDEPLQYSKVGRRDDRRWELDARSGQAEQAMDEDTDEDDDDDEDDTADAPNAPLRFWDLADDLDAEVEEEYDDEDEEEEEEDEEDDTAATVDDELEADELEADEEEEEELEDDLADDELDSDLDEELDIDELDDEDEDEED